MDKSDLNFIWQTGGDSIYIVLVGVPPFGFEKELM